MSYLLNMNRFLLSLCAFSLVMSGVFFAINFEGLITGIAYACVGIYFALVAWNKIVKNWLLLLSGLMFIAVAMAIEVGISTPYLAVVSINFICISLVHYFFTK